MNTGSKDVQHPVVGDITLTYNRMELAADPGLAITILTAEPGTRFAEAHSLLGSWAAMPGQPELQGGGTSQTALTACPTASRTHKIAHPPAATRRGMNGDLLRARWRAARE